MYVALILPVNWLSWTEYGDFGLVLNHLLKKSPEYLRYWQRYEGYKVLDHSLIELGNPDFDDIVAMAKRIGADEIVLPDWLREPKKTLEESRKILENSSWSNWMLVYHERKPFGSVKQYREMLESYPEIVSIGIPKIYHPYRLQLAHVLTERIPRVITVHLLGCDNLLELVGFWYMAVRIDASTPVTYTFHGKKLSIYEPIPRPRVPLAHADLDEDLLRTNIERFKKLLKRGIVPRR